MAKVTDQLDQQRTETFIANAQSIQSGWLKWLRQTDNGFEITDEPKAAAAMVDHFGLIRDGEQIYQGERRLTDAKLQRLVTQYLAAQDVRLQKRPIKNLCQTIKGIIPEQPMMIQPITLADTGTPAPVQYAIKPYLPMGEVSILAGDSGTGKTSLYCALAAMISCGGWQTLDGNKVELPVCAAGKVWIFTEETLLGIWSRFVGCGGLPSNCQVFTTLARCNTEQERHSTIDFESPAFIQMMQKENVKLLVIDPVQAFAPAGMNLNSMSDVRQYMEVLKNIAREVNCAVLLTQHTAKTQRKLQHSGAGSVDFVAACRSLISVVVNPQNPAERYALHTKLNVGEAGKTIRYRITKKNLPDPDNRPGHAELICLCDYSERDYNRDVSNAADQDQSPNAVTSANSPLTPIFTQLIKDNPNGCFVWWSALADLQDESGEQIIDNPVEMIEHIRAMQKDCVQHGFRLRLYVGGDKKRAATFKYNGKDKIPENNTSRPGVFVSKCQPADNPFQPT